MAIERNRLLKDKLSKVLASDDVFALSQSDVASPRERGPDAHDPKRSNRLSFLVRFENESSQLRTLDKELPLEVAELNKMRRKLSRGEIIEYMKIKNAIAKKRKDLTLVLDELKTLSTSVRGYMKEIEYRKYLDRQVSESIQRMGHALSDARKDHNVLILRTRDLNGQVTAKHSVCVDLAYFLRQNSDSQNRSTQQQLSGGMPYSARSTTSVTSHQPQQLSARSSAAGVSNSGSLSARGAHQAAGSTEEKLSKELRLLSNLLEADENRLRREKVSTDKQISSLNFELRKAQNKLSDRLRAAEQFKVGIENLRAVVLSPTNEKVAERKPLVDDIDNHSPYDIKIKNSDGQFEYDKDGFEGDAVGS